MSPSCHFSLCAASNLYHSGTVCMNNFTYKSLLVVVYICSSIKMSTVDEGKAQDYV